MRLNDYSFSVIERRYHIGFGTAQRICDRYDSSGHSLDKLKEMEPAKVEKLFYPPTNIQRKKTPMADFQYYYDRIHEKGRKVNISFCWIEYKQEHPNGYESSQFYEYYKRFVEKTFGKRDATMAVERIP